MSNVISIKSREIVMVDTSNPPAPPPDLSAEARYELAWNNVFAALRALYAVSLERDFSKRGFTDELGRVWAITALIRHAQRIITSIEKRI